MVEVSAAMGGYQEIDIRRADAADLEPLVAFNLAMALETEGRSLDAALVRSGVAAVLDADGHGFYIVAQRRRDQAIVGQLMITYEWSDWRNARFWWIQSVYVASGSRRQGVYRALHRYAERLAQQTGGVCGLRLYVERNNAVARQVYQSLGMSESRYAMYEVEFPAPETRPP